MTTLAYDESQTLRDARARYFQDNAFGDDGGYAAKWAKLQLGPVPFAIPNSAARVRALEFHDLHHLVTGYPTDVVGEAEIGAWEIGGGCASFVAAWILNLYAMVLGLLFGAPGAVWRAFLRGRHTRNLYRTDYDDALLDAPLGEVRARLGLAVSQTAPPQATLGDRISFAFWLAIALALAAATLAPIFLAASWIVRALV